MLAMKFPRFIDPFLAAILGTVALATLAPAPPRVVEWLHHATTFAVALLFFLHGAKLSRKAIKAGAGHVRLHAFVFALTFVVFPLAGLALGPLARPLVGQTLYEGLLFLCALPATVQSAIVFTSLARGNVAAAVCGASASSLIGVLITPVLVRLLLSNTGAGGFSLNAVRDIAVQLLLPFALGHASRPITGCWLERKKALVRVVDQGVIVLVVYVVFCDAVAKGLWHAAPPRAFGGLFLLCALLLAFMLVVSQRGARLFGFERADEITIVFGGSKKSLATGIAMANVLLVDRPMGLMVLPLILFHQIQLMACTVLARRYARDPA